MIKQNLLDVKILKDEIIKNKNKDFYEGFIFGIEYYLAGIAICSFLDDLSNLYCENDYRCQKCRKIKPEKEHIILWIDKKNNFHWLCYSCHEKISKKK